MGNRRHAIKSFLLGGLLGTGGRSSLAQTRKEPTTSFGKQLEDFDAAAAVSDDDLLFSAQSGEQRGMMASQIADYSVRVRRTFTQDGTATVARTAQDKMRECVSIKDWGAQCDGVTDDTAAIQAAIDALIAIGKPFALYFPGRSVVSGRVIFNRTLDCNKLIKNITLFGPPTHTGYDTGNDAPGSITAIGTLDTVFDLRACQQIAIVNLGFAGDRNNLTQFIRIGAEGCAHPCTVGSIGRIENCKFYGANYAINSYLTSGLQLNGNNISRCLINGITMNGSGDANFTNNYINNIGPINDHAASTSYYQGAGILFYGGGGNSNISGGKIEECTKGILIDNAQTFNISGIVFSQNTEFAVGAGGNVNTRGKTMNLAYQARGIAINGNHFVSHGSRNGRTYGCHIYLSNFGSDYEIAVTAKGNTYAWGGTLGIDLDPTVDTLIPSTGPARIVYAVNNGAGTSKIRFISTGNDYLNGALSNTFVGVGTGATIFKSTGDDVDIIALPHSLSGGAVLQSTSVILTGSASFTPGSVAAGASVQLPSIIATGARYGDFVQFVAPRGDMGGLIISGYVTGNDVVCGCILNVSGAAKTPPNGAYFVRIIK